MQLGIMNDPRKDSCEEAQWAADHGFTFLDLTIEGPGADLEHLDTRRLRSILDSSGLDIVGHTAWYLPFASPVARVRQAAVESIVDTFETFANLGVQWVNVHIVRSVRLFSHDDMVRWNGESFAQLAERAEPYGLRIMVEHPPDPEVKISDIRSVLDADERLGFHLDVGHAFVGGDKLEGLLKAFKSRLAHVHMSDNHWRRDDHLPLGVGRVDWPQAVSCIKQTGYDGRITLEVFSPDRDYLLLSARKVREWWEQASSQEPFEHIANGDERETP